jgi:hypothetical protein
MDIYTKVGKYPHLLPREVALWKIFLDHHINEYEYFEYDVHVGQGAEIDPDTETMIKDLALALTRKRIDVIGHKKKSITIFEIKPDAGLSAIGQLVAYSLLLQKERKIKQPLKLNIISDIIDVDTRTVARTMKIAWTIVNIDWGQYSYDKSSRTFIKKG